MADKIEDFNTAWERYYALVYPQGTKEIQHAETKQAFYSGALVVFSMLEAGRIDHLVQARDQLDDFLNTRLSAMSTG